MAKQNILIILGAGATAAISGGTLPVAKNLFQNNYWVKNRQRYPYLERIVCSRENCSLTDAWAIIDTQFKIRHPSSYNKAMLDNRIKSEWYKSKEYETVRFDLYKEVSNPALSIGFYTFIKDALILAGLELKHFLFKVYSQEVDNAYLYSELVQDMKMACQRIAIINMNYDCYFEKAFQKENVALSMNVTSNSYSDEVIEYSKPHGGFNIWHINHSVVPLLTSEITDFMILTDGVHEVRPAMVPYFANPDELQEEHAEQWCDVGFYYRAQQERFKQFFEEADKVVSIGYRFSDDDLHVRQLISGISNRKDKKYLAVLKDEDERKFKKSLKDLFGADVKLLNDGFDKKVISAISDFVNG